MTHRGAVSLRLAVSPAQRCWAPVSPICSPVRQPGPPVRYLYPSAATGAGPRKWFAWSSSRLTNRRYGRTRPLSLAFILCCDRVDGKEGLGPGWRTGDRGLPPCGCLVQRSCCPLSDPRSAEPGPRPSSASNTFAETKNRWENAPVVLSVYSLLRPC